MARVMVALITPFTKEQEIDYPALKALLARLLHEGVDGFIVCGTTAETPTLSEQECYDILDFVLRETRHQVEIWFGCGTNSTTTTLQQVHKAQLYPIDGVLLVTPYYNRPSQEGLYEHFQRIAKHTSLDIMLYNIPSRTGVKLEVPTLRKLLRTCPNIKALKQACGDLDMVRTIKAEFPEFLVYSGEDGMLDEGMEAGMDGLISVMGHVNLPKIKAYLQHNCQDNTLRRQMKQEAALLFQEPSPAGIKYVLAQRHEILDILRLPMTSVQEETLKKQLRATCIDKT